MNTHRESAYTPYVRHCMRFYSRHLHLTKFKTVIDKENWQACHRAIQNYSIVSKDILVYVYGERDTLGDNVFNVSRKYGFNQDDVWMLMREFERKVAIERGLL